FRGLSEWCPSSWEELCRPARRLCWEVVVIRRFSITAPDESSAQDLAAGGLAMYEPVVKGRGSRWRGRISPAGEDWQAIEAMVASWLHRHGLAETSIQVGSVTTYVSARPPEPLIETLVAINGLPEDAF